MRTVSTLPLHSLLDCSTSTRSLTPADNSSSPLFLDAIYRRIYCYFDILAKELCTTHKHTGCGSLHHFYGQELFRCPVISCARNCHGFETQHHRDSHIAKHQRTFKCEILGCDFHTIGFETEADRRDHMSVFHASGYEIEAAWDSFDQQACFRVLCSAAKIGDVGLVRSLLSLSTSKPFDVDFDKLLRTAVAGESEDVLELVIRQRRTNLGELPDCPPEINSAYIEILHNAILNSSVLAVRVLLQKRMLQGLDDTSKVNFRWQRKSLQKGLPSLLLATIAQSESKVALCLEAGAEVNFSVTSTGLYYRKTALLVAAKNSSESIIRTLLGAGANTEIGDSVRSALTYAAEKGDVDVVRLLVERRALVNKPDPSGDPAISWAAARGHLDTVQLLLEKGANIDTPDNNKETSLLGAVANGHHNVTRLLISKGAQVNPGNDTANTALIFAASHGYLDDAHLLLGAERKLKRRMAMVRPPSCGLQ